MAAGSQTQVVIVGGGFGGAFTARSLERRLGRRANVRLTLISRTNYHLMTPLLFEAGSGVVDPSAAVTPLRKLLRRTKVIEATVEDVDLDRRVVHATQMTSKEPLDVPYDQLVLAVGALTERQRIRGSEHAFTFKTLADALTVRSRIIERFEQASVERDPKRRKALLTFVVIGAGLVGVEFTGEMTVFVHHLCPLYDVPHHELEFHLVEAGPHLLPEMEPRVAAYVRQVFEKRGVQLHIHVPVDAIEPGRVRLAGGTVLESETILLAAGLGPNPVIAQLPVEKDRHQRVITEPTMLVKGRDDVWALGDCAHIPDPQGKPYPQLAQHALREAWALARNLKAVLQGRQPKPFRWRSLGTLALVGGIKGVGIVFGVRVRGVLAWAIWRLYYLYRTPNLEGKLRLVADWALSTLFKPPDVTVDIVARSEDAAPPKLPVHPAARVDTVPAMP